MPPGTSQLSIRKLGVVSAWQGLAGFDTKVNSLISGRRQWQPLVAAFV